MKLDRSGLTTHLPGHEGSASEYHAVMNLFDPSFGSAPAEILTAVHTAIVGLPLDHSRRLLWFQRFRRQESLDFESLSAAVRQLRQRLPVDLCSLSGRELTCSQIEGIWGPIAEVSLSWCPPLTIGSLEALNDYAVTVATMFDELLPRTTAGGDGRQDTLAVLKYEGELYFEGDDPWGTGRKQKGGP